MRINRKGSTRVVVLIAGLAFKFPYFRFSLNGWSCGLQGMIANINEKRFSNVYTAIFNPTLFSVWGGFMNVQKRADPFIQEHYEKITVFREMAVSTGMVEDKIDSFGWIGSKIVVIDYDGAGK